MHNFIKEMRAVNVQANQKIDTVENSLNKRIDGFQRKIDQKSDILKNSISMLTNQHIHQEEESLEEECLSNTMVEEQCQQQLQEGLIENSESSAISAVVCPWEKNSPMLTEGGSGKEVGEELIKLILQPIPINLDPNATAQPRNSSLLVYILPSPATQSIPKTPAAKAKANSSLHMQNLKKLVATAQIFATTSNKLAAAHTGWHSGWFGCDFRYGAPRPRHFYKLHQFQ